MAKFPTVKITELEHTFFLSETSAITEWFSARQQSLGTMNVDSFVLVDYCYWKIFAEATFMPNLALKQIFSQLAIRTLWLIRFIPRAIQYGFNQGYLNPLLQQQIEDRPAFQRALSKGQWSASIFKQYWAEAN